MASVARKLRPKKDQNVRPESSKAADHAEIAVRAYELWQERGCPIGSAEVDWFLAEELLSVEKARALRQPLFETEQRDDIGVVRISGRFATGTDYAYVAAETLAIKNLGGAKLIADICELDSVGSEGIGFFVELHASRTKKPGGIFVLAGPTPRVLEVLNLCGLIPIIRIAADLESALALCAANPDL